MEAPIVALQMLFGAVGSKHMIDHVSHSYPRGLKQSRTMLGVGGLAVFVFNDRGQAVT